MLPPEIQQKRAKLISGIQSLLSECRESKHWRSKDEDRLQFHYLEEVPEEMIPYTSIPNLLRIHENLESLSLFLRNLPDEPLPLKITAIQFQQVEEYYRTRNERLVLQALESREMWLSLGYRIAYYPGTCCEIHVDDSMALFVPENV
jgi:hypothetical protein